MELKVVSSLHDNEATKLLSDALKRARKGDLRNVALLSIDNCGNVQTGYAGNVLHQRILFTGGLYELISEINEG